MRVSENFSCQVIKRNSEIIVIIRGELDMLTVSELQNTVWYYMTDDVKKATFDCGFVGYVDSAFLQFITRLAKQLNAVKIVNASRTIRTIFEITGLEMFLA